MDESPVFSVLLGLGVSLVVKVLPATGAIATNYLQLAVRWRVDRNICPGRRYPQLFNSREIGGWKSLPIDALVPESSLRPANSDYSSPL